jgi:hypothetical protein
VQSNVFSGHQIVFTFWGLLQDGSNGKTQLIQEFAEDIGAILIAASETGNTLDKIWAAEIAGSAPKGVLLKLLREAFDNRSQWLRGVAFRQAARLVEIPADVATSSRMNLIRSPAHGRLLRQRIETQAQLGSIERSRPISVC